MILVSCLLAPGLGGDLDPRADYRAERSNPVTYQVDFRAILTAPHETSLLRVWVPVPPSDAAQEVSGSHFTTFPLQVEPSLNTEPVFGNTFAYFEFEDPQGAQIIQHEFTVKAWELRWSVDPAKVEAVSDWPAGFGPFLRGEEQAVVIDERVRAIAADLVPAKGNPADGLGRVIQWVNANMEYDHGNASLAASSQHALDQRAGHCSDYHGLCASLGRSLGFPTRVAYGINTFPKSSPTHCKLEAFLPGYGWVSFDVSETHKLVAEIGKNASLGEEQKRGLIAAADERLLRGFRDNTWYLQTRGTDYELAPRASQRVPVVRTLYAEADGKPLRDPDPANVEQHEYAWMTAHRYVADRAVTYPFKDLASLEPK